MLRIGHQQVRGVGPGRLAGGRHRGRARLAQVLGVVAVVVDDPADQAQRQRQVGGRLDRHPAVAVAGSQAGRRGQDRRHHHVAEGVVLARARLGQFATLALERVAGLRRRGADEQAELGARPVGLAVRHAADVAQRRTGADAEALPAVRAMVAEVGAAERLLGEAPDQRGAPLVGGIGEHELVRLGAVLGVLRVDQRLRVEGGAQAVHMAFTEQVAAFADFLHQVFERDALPLAAAARADALERLQHAVRVHLLLGHGRAARAGGGAVAQAAVAAKAGEHIAHRGFHGGGVAGGQRVVGVAGHAQDAVAFGVHPHAHAALRPAAEAARHAHRLARLGLQLAGGRIDAELRRERIAARGVRRHFARAAGDQALAGLEQGLAIAGREGRQAAGGNAAAREHLALAEIGRRRACRVLGFHCVIHHQSP